MARRRDGSDGRGPEVVDVLREAYQSGRLTHIIEAILEDAANPNYIRERKSRLHGDDELIGMAKRVIPLE